MCLQVPCRNISSSNNNQDTSNNSSRRNSKCGHSNNKDRSSRSCNNPSKEFSAFSKQDKNKKPSEGSSSNFNNKWKNRTAQILALSMPILALLPQTNKEESTFMAPTRMTTNINSQIHRDPLQGPTLGAANITLPSQPWPHGIKERRASSFPTAKTTATTADNSTTTPE